MGIFFLRSIDLGRLGENQIGYYDKFDGLGVFVNSQKQKRNGDQLLNQISLAFNDGTVPLSAARSKSNRTQSCYRPVRNLESNEEQVHLQIAVTKKAIVVSVFDRATGSFTQCAMIEQALEFDPIFLITASSGSKNPDFHYLHQFMLYDTTDQISELEKLRINRLHDE